MKLFHIKFSLTGPNWFLMTFFRYLLLYSDKFYSFHVLGQSLFGFLPLFLIKANDSLMKVYMSFSSTGNNIIIVFFSVFIRELQSVQ